MPDGVTTQQPITYVVAMREPASHEFEVEMRVPALPEHEIAEIVFPTWAPGSYMVRDFVRHVFRLTVTDERGRALARERVDKQRWRIATGGRAFRLRYRVFAFEASVRTSFLDDSHGYWNGTSLFFHVAGELGRPCRVTVVPPARSGWRIATALPPVPGARNTFAAADYDALVDAPFEVGTHETRVFSVGRTKFELALYGRHNADVARLCDILRRIAAATGRIFGGFPFDRYLFIVHALPVATGGLEHRASVTMDIAGLGFEDEAGYRRFADLAAHEFFHAWNVKRLHDAALTRLDYTGENYTRLLWFFEGFTDYLAHVIMLRAGVTTERDFHRMLAEDWPKYAQRPGRNETPLDELSFEAWIKQYKPSENYVNRAVSYYERGLWTGMALDIELRLATHGRRGLPDMFRRMWDRLAKVGWAITEADVRDAAAAVILDGTPKGSRAPRDDARQAKLGGRHAIRKRLDRFFDRYVHGTDELDLPALWRRAGLTAAARPEWDLAGKPAPDRDAVRARRARAWTGIDLHPERTLVRNVVPGSPAWRAGITFGDDIVAVGGARVNAATFAKRVGDADPGARLPIAFFRRDLLREATLTVAESPARTWTIAADPRAGARAAAVRAGWLGGARRA